MRNDRRQIQTAVLGSADSDDPLMLPLEAIELNAFRRRHEHDTFWCGLLLGGCGSQLTTKLYTDRACHFAHHPAPDGQPHLCRRRARGVASADHLYVKSAAATWLRGSHDEQARFDFTQPEGAPVGSVMDIQFEDRGLRVHLDQTVLPAWDQENIEPVLGMSVPVDRDTLINRWYVHRIGLHSEGTTRRVRIGTEAFSRPTEWFALDECNMTERGLSTPAVERIVRSRSSRPVSPWSAGTTGRAPDAHGRAHKLLRRLTDARTKGSVVAVARVCRAIAAVTDVDEKTRGHLEAALVDAQRWLEDQAEVRRELFDRLQEAVTAQNGEQIRSLLVRVNATANHDRTETESRIVGAAALQLAAHRRQRQTAVAAAQREADNPRQAADLVRTLLASLRRHGRSQPREAMRSTVRQLLHAAEEAGDRLNPSDRGEINAWKKRAGLSPLSEPDVRRAPAERVPKQKKKPLLYEQVDRHSWFKKPCPRCGAAKNNDCVNDDGVGSGSRRQLPHDERLRLIIGDRESRADRPRQPKLGRRSRAVSPTPSPSWQVTDVACPDCSAGPGARCATPDGRPHQSRVTRFKRRFPSA